MLEIRAGLGQQIMAELLQGIKASQRQEDKCRTLTGNKDNIQAGENGKTQAQDSQDIEQD
jgi:hypothetical protein